MPKPVGQSSEPFDVIIVLGNPANSDGSPGILMASRVEKAVQILKSGQAHWLLMTGGGVYNSFIEAEVMGAYAQELGIDPSAIFVEKQARDTYQNARLAAQVCRERGWTRVIVVPPSPGPEHFPARVVRMYIRGCGYSPCASLVPAFGLLRLGVSAGSEASRYGRQAVREKLIDRRLFRNASLHFHLPSAATRSTFRTFVVY